MTIWHILGFVVFTMLSAYLASNPKNIFSRITDNHRSLLPVEATWCRAHGIDQPVIIHDEQTILGMISSAFAFGIVVFALGDSLDTLDAHPALIAIGLIVTLGSSAVLNLGCSSWLIRTWILNVVFRHDPNLHVDSVKKHLSRSEWFEWNMLMCNACNPLSYVLSLLMLGIRSRAVMSLHKNRPVQPKEAVVKQSWSDKWYNAIIDRAKHDQD